MPKMDVVLAWREGYEAGYEAGLRDGAKDCDKALPSTDSFTGNIVSMTAHAGRRAAKKKGRRQ